MITQKQIWLYWREWNAVRKALEGDGYVERSPRVLGPTMNEDEYCNSDGAQ